MERRLLASCRATQTQHQRRPCQVSDSLSMLTITLSPHKPGLPPLRVSVSLSEALVCCCVVGTVEKVLLDLLSCSHLAHQQADGVSTLLVAKERGDAGADAKAEAGAGAGVSRCRRKC